MNRTQLKNKLKQNKLTIGTWLTLAHPSIAEIMGKAGFDWVGIDLEHTSITHREAEDLIRVLDLCGVSPLVRLTSVTHDQIKRMMDCGAHGVIAPMINSKSDVEKVISGVYYPPKGTRGMGLARAQGYGATFSEYQTWAKEAPVIVVQIEHVNAIANLKEILSFEEVDAFMVGPYDLSSSLGIPGQFDHPKMIEALQKIQEAMIACKKPGGFHVVEPSPEIFKKRMQEGYKFMVYSTDMRMLDSGFRAIFKEVERS